MLTHRQATLQDVELLTAMNRQLIEDEQHPRNILMTMAQLQDRMHGFLSEDYRAVVFKHDGRPVAYALFRDRGESIYLRQFFVARDCRRQGLGREAIRILRERVWPCDRRLTVEVLVSNQRGCSFWRSVGYRDYSIELEILPGDAPAAAATEPAACTVRKHPPANIQILPARESDFPVVKNLIALYIYDFTEHTGWRCPETGLFGGCDEFFEDLQAGRNRVFVIRADGELAGFTGIKDFDEGRGIEHDIPDFFVLRKFRRRGVGRRVAFHLFNQFPGRWQVRQMMDNTPAIAFWRKIIADYSASRFTESRRMYPWGEMNVIRFETSAVSCHPSC